jgi:integrase
MATIRKHYGKWQVIIRRKGYPAVVKSFTQKSTASSWAKQTELDMEKETYNDVSIASRTTLREVLLKYRDEGIRHLKSARTVKSKINLILKDPISSYGLLQLRSKHVWAFKERISEGRSGKTINMYIETLNTVWKYARKNLSIAVPAEAPAALVSKEKVNNEREVTLTTEEYQRLLKEANNQPTKWGQWPFPILEDLIRFAVLTCARYSEITGLLRKDVDFNTKLATFRDTKNGTDRTIPLSDEVISILKKYPFGDKFFPIQSRDRFKMYWYRARRRANLEHLRFHDLRSVGITFHILNGMQLHEVALLSGHKTLSVLHRRYLRLKPEDLLEKVNKPNIVKIR